MKFLVTVEVTNSGECVVEAPSREAVDLWLSREKDNNFQEWYFEISGAEIETDVSECDMSRDLTIDENGKEMF